MKRMRSILFLFLFLGHLMLSGACSAEFSFSDERFRNKLTTENLDAIIDEYELFDGWYWTTKADVTQDFHGHPDSPGWNTTVDKKVKKECLPGWYGCRWPIDHVRKAAPDEGGYAECFAFAQFIGYLLSGELNPQHNWEYFYNTRKSDGLKKSGGLRVGDILRAEYKKDGKYYQHSAVVYAVNGEEILFLQVSGSNYNRISVGRGFTDGNVQNATSLAEISSIPWLKICRYSVPGK